MKRYILVGAAGLLILWSIALRSAGIKGGGSGNVSSIDASAITGTIDISSQTNFSVASSGLISQSGDSVASNDLFIKECFFTNPVTGHSDVCQLKFPYAATVVRISCATDVATSTADIEFEERAEATPDTAGTEVMGADLQCDTDGAVDTTFDNASIAANDLMSLKITAVANAPTKLRVYVSARYTP